MEEAFAAQEVKAEQQQEVQQGLQTANNELEAANTDLHTALEHAASQIQVLEVPQPLCSLSLYAHSPCSLTPPGCGALAAFIQLCCLSCLVWSRHYPLYLPSCYPLLSSAWSSHLRIGACISCACVSTSARAHLCVYLPLPHVSSCWVI